MSFPTHAHDQKYRFVSVGSQLLILLSVFAGFQSNSKGALSDSEEDTDEERDFSNLYVNYIPCSILFIVTLP